jgi:hypothetical protein
MMPMSATLASMVCHALARGRKRNERRENAGGKQKLYRMRADSRDVALVLAMRVSVADNLAAARNC